MNCESGASTFIEGYGENITFFKEGEIIFKTSRGQYLSVDRIIFYATQDVFII